MIVSGLSQEDKELLIELEEMEASLLDKQLALAPEIQAQGLTCLAYDYITIGLEEKGHELLLSADKLYPGYHKSKMKEHMNIDPDFNRLIKLMANELIILALTSTKDIK